MWSRRVMWQRVVWWQGNCTRGGRSITVANVVGPQAFVFLGGNVLGIFERPCPGFFKVPLQIRDAPAAAGPCAATFADLTGAARLMNADEV